MSKPSKVSTNVDFAAKGKQVGYLSAPHSRNDSGWGAARFPIACIANGSGPTVFFTGGNHGDEYEGPIALTRLIQALEPALGGMAGAFHIRAIPFPRRLFGALGGSFLPQRIASAAFTHGIEVSRRPSRMFSSAKSRKALTP